MALQKFVPSGDAPSVIIKPLSFSTGPCHKTFGQLWNELLEHQLLPRRYHAWYSRNGVHSGDENDDGMSFPLSYNMLVERHSHIEKDHLVKLLKQLILNTVPPSRGMGGGNIPNAADVPTLMGTGSFSLLSYDTDKGDNEMKHPPAYMRWPHMKADQVPCYAIAKPSTMVQSMHKTTKLRGHRNAVYCAIFDRSGRYVITGSDDRLVKIWSMDTAYCLVSCRGHEGDITDLAVSSNNAVVASSSNDCIIRVWRLPDGLPISILRGHTGAVTAIAFNPRPNSIYHLLSSSDDGTCRIWDAKNSQQSPQIYIPRPSESVAGKNSGPSSSTGAHTHQIFCCAFNASGTVFVTGSSDTLARVWIAYKPNSDGSTPPNHEIDVLSGHENDVNYVQFSGCAVASRFMTADTLKEENIPKFKNSWFTHDNIVTCSRDGSAIIWIPRSRRSHGKAGRWARAYHLKVPPPPMPPQPPRGGPRQRILPTPRGVNMIIWSLDNRFVLAAIMDCRICVWNASDGSLVHSLTGHSESTYVLDVHPFNPRMAMSAGYDGNIIVWDIWEGKPIWKYDISRFKLVDGKFSPDGTSIILSDDVGQLYIVWREESHINAKYDQFFLGDYRPYSRFPWKSVIPVIHFNCSSELQVMAIIETGNSAYTIQKEYSRFTLRLSLPYALETLGMIPYPEPYQSAYQQRRLGALGIEWHPTSLKLSTGPDFSLDPEYQMLPLADLDILTEPLPEFAEIMDWEPENEMQSDDNDSEYNGTEDCSTAGEQGSLSSNSSVDPQCSAEDNFVDQKEKQKAEIEIMTSSGRRVKRRNLDECDGNLIKNRNRKSRNGRKASGRKSSTSKSLRPQRAAARNALTLFSKITGTSTDVEDEDCLEIDTSESESMLHDSNVESDGSDKYLQNEQRKHLKGKEISLDESEDIVKPQGHEFHLNGGNRKRLVLKLPLRDSNKNVAQENTTYKGDNQVDLVGSSSKVPQGTIEGNGNFTKSLCSPEDAICSTVEKMGGVHLDKVSDQLSLSEGCKYVKISWGGARARTSKRLRLGEVTPSDAFARTSLCLDSHYEKENNGSLKPDKDCGTSEGQNLSAEANGIEHSNSSECRDYDKPSKSIHDSAVPDDNTTNRIDSDHGGGGGGSLESDNLDERNVMGTTNLDGDGNVKGEGTSNVNNHNLGVGVDFHEESIDVARRTRSMGLRMSTGGPNIAADDHKSGQGDKSGYSFRSSQNSSMNRCQLPQEEWGSSSRVTVRLRSTRNRRANYNVRDTSPVDRRKSNKSSKKGSWLMLSMHEEGSRYIPQLGDEVAYLRQGHQEYIEHRGLRDLREDPPWISTRGSIRAVEFCKVQGLEYSSESGSGDSCCKMTLEFVDPSSKVYGKSFKLTLPEVTGFPDFLVERTRYDAAIQRNWTHRDKCKVWWKNEDEEDGVGGIDMESKIEATFTEATFYKQVHHCSLSLVMLLGFPVPLSLEVIQSRLENNYYRSVEALKHDFTVMLSNAETYGNNSEILVRLKRLSDWFFRTISSV
ncbi:hypothetical protein FNV43_RR00976 [Rhamnella rubrinervis]|uniref:Bromo domain-containing protein n=1 Tax=Rhamnella rubrinervis TaxID=2594499 RepID=A0A8K0HPK0_9ROSA|nr:hypothetical protein FNV43_RR00976 [Rhamnella rubrinervis]